jgi:multiple sugar transport system substrate-binding protein
MRKFRRMSLLAALGLTVSAMLTACQSGADESGASGGAGGDLKGEITVMVPGGGYYFKHFNEFLAKKFMERHPGVKVKVEQEPEGGQLTARIAAGDKPDVLVGVFGYQPAKYAKERLIVDLKKMPGSKELFDRISPQYIHEDFGGRYYVPWNATTQLMIYNKELFKKAGLDPEKPPQTWDEYLKAAEKIQKLPPQNGSKVYGNVFWNEALSWGGWYWTMKSQIWYNFNDGKYRLFNELGTDVEFDKPEAKMKEFLDFMKQAQKYAPENMKGNEFFSRNVGMWLQFGYGWKVNLKEAKGKPMVIGQDVGVAPIPTDAPGKTHWSTLDGRSLMIFKSNPQRERIAWEFIRFMMEDKINLESLKAMEQLPTLKSLENDPYFQTPENKPFVEQLKHAVPNEPVAELDEVSNILLKQYVRSVIKGEISTEQAVKEAAKEARSVLAK